MEEISPQSRPLCGQFKEQKARKGKKKGRAKKGLGVNGIIGFDWNQYHLWNNAGFFVNFNFSGPMTTDTDDFYCYFQFGNMLGPAVKFDINKVTNISVGTTAQFHFSNVDDSAGWTKRYSMAGLRPYIGISFHLSDVKFLKDALLL
jgi:hypothetical protein